MAYSVSILQRIGRSVSLVLILALSLGTLWHQRNLAPSFISFQGFFSKTIIAEGLDGNTTTITITRNGGTSNSTYPLQRQLSPRTAMVIAVLPNSWLRLSTLWTQLECFSSKFDMIIIAAPVWSRDIVEPVLQRAIETIPGLDQKLILARYFVNDRYDVGLWCDTFLEQNQSTYGFISQPQPEDMAWRSLLSNQSSLEHVLLINDSVWALEHSSEVLDALRNNQTLQMVSLSYSKLGNESTKPHGFWLESVQRAFTMDALKVFLDAKCVPASHPFYCQERVMAWRRKRCIVVNFEILTARLYAPGTIMGVYPSDVPPRLLDPKRLRIGGIKTWVGNIDYWMELRKTTKFPVAKASSTELFQEAKQRRPADFLTCSQYMDSLLSLNLTFPPPEETETLTSNSKKTETLTSNSKKTETLTSNSNKTL